MISQVIDKAIPSFERAYPGHIGVFTFDNSSGHACKADDALVAGRMNLLPGEKQPRMRDTIFSNCTGGHAIRLEWNAIQHMVFQSGDREISNAHH